MQDDTLPIANSAVFVKVVMGRAKMSHLRVAAGVTHVAVNSGGVRCLRTWALVRGQHRLLLPSQKKIITITVLVCNK